MNPPTTEAFHQAISILQESVRAQNPLQPLQSYGTQDALAQRLDELDAIQAAFKDALDAKRVETKRLHNASSPIHKLPQEIFSEILWQSLFPEAWSMELKHNLAQVSKRWSTTIRDSKRFWRHISDEQSVQVRQIVQQRNPVGPLVFRCRTPDAFGAIMGPLADRCHTLIYTGSITHAFSDALVAATELKFLSVNVVGRGQPQYLSVPPNMKWRHLDLAGVGMAWNASRLRYLKTFTLRNYPQQLLPKIEHLRGFLQAAPDLQRLVIGCFPPRLPQSGMSPPTHTINSSPSIPFPSLSVFYASLVPNDFLNDLISSINASACRCIRITEPITLSRFHRDSLTSLCAFLAPALQSAEALALTYTEGNGIMHVATLPVPFVALNIPEYDEDQPGLFMRFDMQDAGSQWTRVAETLVTKAPSRATTRVTIRGGAPPFMSNPRVVVPPLSSDLYLHLFPNMRHLTFENGCDAMEPLRLLSKPFTAEDGNDEWLCPMLTTLAVGPCSRYKEAEVYAVLLAILQDRPRQLEELKAPSKLAKSLSARPEFERMRIVSF